MRVCIFGFFIYKYKLYLGNDLYYTISIKMYYNPLIFYYTIIFFAPLSLYYKTFVFSVLNSKVPEFLSNSLFKTFPFSNIFQEKNQVKSMSSVSFEAKELKIIIKLLFECYFIIKIKSGRKLSKTECMFSLSFEIIQRFI